MSMDEIRILIADDHQIIVDGIRALIEGTSGICVCATARNGREAVQKTALVNPTIILMDIDMPEMNGLEATKIITRDFPDVKIIILSMHHEKGLIKSMLEAGASGYLLKNSDQEELIQAIRKVASNQQYFSSDVTLSLLNKKTTKLSAFQSDTKMAELTRREIEILKLIADGFSNKEIGEQLFISHRTVDTHRTNLMNKLEVNNIAGLIRYAISHGFVS